MEDNNKVIEIDKENRLIDLLVDAVKAKNFYLVKLILQKDLDKDSCIDQFNNVLYLSSSLGNTEIVQVLRIVIN